ncbi:MAG: PD40 domain-containing protein [Planctomycetes bacterium]|nr:PD40 domain-containing protein [Planctomycetota bacterium]
MTDQDGVFRVFFDNRPPQKLCVLPRVSSIHASPDGKWLACEVAQEAMIEGVRYTIAVVEVATGKVSKLGRLDHYTSPVWSPDCKTLAYSDDFVFRLYDPTEGKLIKEIKPEGAESQPFWNPKDNSLWASQIHGARITRWNGKKWEHVLEPKP